MKSLLFCLPLLWTAKASSEPVRLHFAAEPGTRCVKTLQQTTEIAFDGFSVVMNGSEVDPQFLPEIDLDSTDTLMLTVAEEVRSATSEGPTELVWSFETATREVDESVEVVGMGNPEDTFGEGESPLTGLSVELRAVEDGWDARWGEGDSGPDELLETLNGDLHLTGLLPEDEVEIGDAWTVEATAIGSLFQPGGELGIVLEGEGSGLEIHNKKPSEVGPLTGEIEVRFEKVETVTGTRVARLAMEGEVETWRVVHGDLSEVPVADGTATTRDEVLYDVTGWLEWDLDAGMLRSLRADCDLSIDSHTVKDEGQEGGDYEMTSQLVGSLTVELGVEPAD